MSGPPPHNATPPTTTAKGRGAFFTPEALCRHMVAWAIRSGDDRVLEPSCGEAAFLLAAGRRRLALGAHGGGALDGVEVHPPSATQARRAVARAGLSDHLGRIRVGDFFSLEPLPEYDAVVGNPPYVRYQDFHGEARARARAAALRGGVRLSALASSWAAFTVHAAHFLRPGGRLALVLPAELLSTNYAAEVRRFLMRRFGVVRLILFTERVFPDVQEEVVVLLAEGTGPTDHCRLHQVANLDALVAEGGGAAWTPNDTSAKWTPALLSAEARDAYDGIAAMPEFGTLHQWGETTLGAVTGNNAYFTLTDAQVSELGIPRRDLLPISPPGSRHLRQLRFTTSDWRTMRDRGARVWLLHPGERPAAATQRYIADGLARGVDGAYKCRVRTPWWRTPTGPPADLLVTYMNADTPRLALNGARVHHLNSVHGLYLHPDTDAEVAPLLPLAALNSMTMVGAETVGRAYGGGMLKLEPREADRLPVPTPAAVAACADRLQAVQARARQALAQGRPLDAVALVDAALLVDGLGVDHGAVAALAASRDHLAGRRRARGGRTDR